MDNLNIIKIIEKGNRLDIETTYTPVVCGNSNYFLKFDFDSDWAACETKTAVFIVEGKKFPVSFTGDTVEVPALPNSNFVHVVLTAAKNENCMLTSTALRLRLEPSPLAGDMSEFDPVAGYFPKVLSLLDTIKKGDITAKDAHHAITADTATAAEVAESANFAEVAGASRTQVDLSSDQTISGVKNFVGSLQVNGVDVASLGGSTTVGANLILNSNFKINQRGLSEYNCMFSPESNLETRYPVIYTVDRWKGFYGLNVKVLDNGVQVRNTGSNTDEDGATYDNVFTQIFEWDYSYYANEKMSLSCTVNGEKFAATATLPSEVSEAQDLITINLGNHGGAEDDLFRLSFGADGNLNVNFKIAANSSFNIQNVKLEYGDATEYKVPFELEEMKKCRRYYLKTHKEYLMVTSRGSKTFSNNIIYYPVEMHVAPYIVKYFSYGKIGSTAPAHKTNYSYLCSNYDGISCKVHSEIRTQFATDICAGGVDGSTESLVSGDTYIGGMIADAEFYTAHEINCIKTYYGILDNEKF